MATAATQTTTGARFRVGLLRRVGLILGACAIGIAATVVVASRGDVAAADEPTSLAVGRGHVCVVLLNGGIDCWGRNNNGQLGDSTTIDRTSHDAVDGVTTAISVAAGSDHTCAVLADQSASCWGSGFFGQLGRGSYVLDNPTAVAVTGLTDVEQLSAGSRSTCAIRTGGLVSCWGNNAYGQLGDGNLPTSTNAPVAVPSLTQADVLTSGGLHHCVLNDDDTVQCWGRNNRGQLGNNSTSDSDVPVPVSGLTSVAAVDAGDSYTCAVKHDGTAWCWGFNSTSQLGDGKTTQAETPVQVTGITDAIDVVAGNNSTCLLHTDRSVSCLGDNDEGQLGDGTTSGSTTLVAVGTLADVAWLDSRGSTVCALDLSASLACWGSNEHGVVAGTNVGYDTTPSERQLANGNSVNAVAIDLGTLGTLCLAAGGRLGCAGNNEQGQVGDGTTIDQADLQNVISSDASDAAVGSRHSCVLFSGGSAECWGEDGFSGVLGDGSDDDGLVNNLATGVEIDAGENTTCARLSGGTVRCWGNGVLGQVGNGANPVTVDEPSAGDQVSGVTDAIALAVGNAHGCVITGGGSSGPIECWGRNLAGQLGNGGNSDQNAPVSVSAITDATAISAGHSHTCAIVGTGSVMCWGSNIAGQLGDGTDDNSNTPVSVSGLTDAVAIAAGDAHTCAVRTGGSVQCWGYNTDGALGDGTTTSSLTPVTVSTIADGIAPIAADEGTCVRRSGGGTWCWGRNLRGELGFFPYFTTPQVIALSSPPLVPTTTTTTTSTTSTTSTTTTTVPDGGGDPEVFISVDPRRFADTRPDRETIDGQFVGDGKNPAMTSYEVQIAGRGEVPLSATAAIINLTTVVADAPGHATVYPCTDTVPRSSAANYQAGGVDPNEVIAKLSDTGTVCVYTHSTVHLLLDVVGYTEADSAYIPIDPARYADSRDRETFDGLFLNTGALDAGEIWEIQIADRGEIPPTATTAALNVTAVAPDDAGHLTIYPCTDDVPTASSLNYTAGMVRPNEVVAKLSDSGTVCVYTHATTQLIVDAVGFIEPTPTFTSTEPTRYADSRNKTTFDSQFLNTGPNPAGTTWEIDIAGRGIVPDNATTAVINVTVVLPDALGHATVYPCTGEVPRASSLNYIAGDVRANELIAKLSDAGTICIYTHANTHVIVDVTGHNGTTP